MSSSSGYGICGHKNAFSSGVKVGNYVEDRIGGHLASTSHAVPMTSVSESHTNHINPREMPDKSHANAPQDNHALLERELLRGGLSYNLLFKHGSLDRTPTQQEIAASFQPASLAIGAALVKSSPTKTSLPQVQQNQHDHDPQARRLTRELEQRKYAAMRERNYPFVTSAQTQFALSDLHSKPK